MEDFTSQFLVFAMIISFNVMHIANEFTQLYNTCIEKLEISVRILVYKTSILNVFLT